MIILYIFCAILFLILITVICGKISENSSNKVKILELEKTDYEKLKQKLKAENENELSKIHEQKENVLALKNYYEKLITDFDKIIKEKCNYYPQMAAIMSDLLTLYYERSAKYLETKNRPAPVESHRIRELRNDTKQILFEKKLLEYKYNYIVELFPNITDIFDDGFNTNEVYDFLSDENIDTVRYFIADDEYKKMSVVERNQLALDNYLKRPKTKWQIGRDYELFIGYLYAQKGFSVRYNGIIEKLEDMGRDLIASKHNKTLIIQCKNWAQEKNIHEKHIFQLYGTVVLYKLTHQFEEVHGVFITTTGLSEKAKEVATYLNIEVVERFEMREFPRIKCNINKTTKEKIYHLPFDLQYDSVIIEEDKGECFALTVLEAEEKGFRRTYKWHGQGAQ